LDLDKDDLHADERCVSLRGPWMMLVVRFVSFGPSLCKVQTAKTNTNKTSTLLIWRLPFACYAEPRMTVALMFAVFQRRWFIAAPLVVSALMITDVSLLGPLRLLLYDLTTAPLNFEEDIKSSSLD